MALKAPGIEIREIDKSQYSQAPNPTQVYIVGFAQKGELYKRMVFTSRAAWLLYYGEPTNEAERYFYNACMEVINQGGTLYCARIPYENESKEKYVAKKYSVETKFTEIPEIYEDYIVESKATNLLDGRYSRFGFGFSDGNDGAVAVVNTAGEAERMEKISESENINKLAFDYYYSATSFEYDTDWVAFRQDSIYNRLVAMFDTTTEVGSMLALDKTELWKFLKDTEAFQGKTAEDATPVDWVKAFCYAYEDMFGKDAVSTRPWNFVFENYNTKVDGEFKPLRKFLESNRQKFNSIVTTINKLEPKKAFDESDITSMPELDDYLSDPALEGKTEEEKTNLFNTDLETWNHSDLRYANLTPFVFFESEDKCNLMACYTAAVNMLGISGNTPVYWKELNTIIEMSKFLDTDQNAAKAKTEDSVAQFISFIKTTTGVKYLSGYTEEDNDAAKAVLSANSAKIYNFIQAMSTATEYVALKELLSSASFEDTLFAKKCIELYLDNTNVTGNWDLITLRKAKNLASISGKPRVDSIIRNAGTPGETEEIYSEEANDSGENYDPNYASYFEKYRTVVTVHDVEYVVDSVDKLIEVTARQLSKVELIECMTDVLESENFSKITNSDEFNDHQAEYGLFNIDEAYSMLKWSEIREEDLSIKDAYMIKSATTPFLLDQDAVTEYEADETRVPLNSFYIVDKTRAKYGKCKAGDTVKNSKGEDVLEIGDDHECLGIIPVVTTAANALKAQKIIDASHAGDAQFGLYEPLKTVQTLNFTSWSRPVSPRIEKKTVETLIDDLTETSIKFYTNDPDDNETVSQMASSFFPSIASTDKGLDREHMKKIGVVVFKAFLDAAEGNKISFNLVESFVGELDRGAVNPNTGASTFIDTIVNSQSEYIYFFSNCFSSSVKQLEYRNEADILLIEPQRGASLGFYEDMVKDDISLTKSIYDGLNKSFEKSSNIDEVQIDVVVDAGMSNIAQYIYSVFGPAGKGVYDPCSTEAAMYKLKSKDSIKTWKTVIMDYFNNFCKNVRKDCMFVCDGPRPLALSGNKKIVRSTKPANTIDANILPYIVYISGLNTNFGAGYCDWFQVTDEFSGDYFWCPPSIKAMGIYIYTDANFYPWYAPAGLNRGIVNALDVAFSPTNKQGGEIYEKSWNYAVNYPNDGITLWGQKTLQAKPSALDRVNVRRGLLYLERAVYLVARYFMFEQNTAYTRQRFVDLITPTFEFCKSHEGLYDYKIIADESVNTPDTIDRNEFHCKIGLKFVKAMEFLYIDFITLRTGASWSEM